ncbi:hypothetical protein, partial [Aliivibrio fischeri]
MRSSFRLRCICVAGIMFVVAMTWLGLDGHQDYLLDLEALRQNEKISIDGMLNMASVYAWIAIFAPFIPLLFVVVITGRQANYLPKIFWKFYGVIVVCSFVYGIYVHFNLEYQVGHKGYVECKDERVLKSKYSKRVYA